MLGGYEVWQKNPLSIYKLKLKLAKNWDSPLPLYTTFTHLK